MTARTAESKGAASARASMEAERAGNAEAVITIGSALVSTVWSFSKMVRVARVVVEAHKSKPWPVAVTVVVGAKTVETQGSERQREW